MNKYIEQTQSCDYYKNYHTEFNMKLNNMFITTVILLKLFLLKFNFAEWIDMPEFSDETKVYRIPTTKQDYFHKFIQSTTEDQLPDVYRNVTSKHIETEEAADNESSDHVSHKIINSIDEPVVQTYSNEEGVVDIKQVETRISLEAKKQERKKKYFNESLESNSEEMLRYLPVDILKEVHQTLRSQPTSSEGKIQFLKVFENTLITEIESRLTRAMTTSRKKRGAEHYEHGSENDHSAGFPSIEGALMAISFLTFAVYLVRLVMLLFRNMNNTVATTGATTLLLGRRKRSTNKFDDDLAILFRNKEEQALYRILNNL